MAHGFEFSGALAVKQLAMLIEDGERRHALGQWNLVSLGDLLVLVQVPDVDVDQDVIRIQQRLIGRIVEINIQNLAVTAPVTAKIEDQALMVASRGFESGSEVGAGLFGRGIDVGQSMGGQRKDERPKPVHEQDQRRDRRQAELRWPAESLAISTKALTLRDSLQAAWGRLPRCLFCIANKNQMQGSDSRLGIILSKV